MLLLIGSFIAGLLTVLAPCVLPLLPVIIGGSMSGDNRDRKRPLIIIASLAISLFVFTLLLKVTTAFINVPPLTFSYISGGIIILLGIFTLFPSLYARVIAKLGIEQRAQKALGTGYRNKNKYLGPIIIGAALGPVFSSCSPVYAYILATILPADLPRAIAYVLAYIAGLAVVLLLIGYFGQRFISRIKFASNPKGTFQRVLAIIFIIVGLLIITGYDKRFQVFVSTHTPLNFDSISAKFLPDGRSISDDKLFNVKAYEAPELVPGGAWINSQPQTLKELRGKVVLVDFWTYSCINCIRNNPYLIEWQKTYKDDGLVVIGVHAPEFSFEKKLSNVQKAVRDQKIPYPVVLDNEFKTWNAFQNRSWPASYLIDANGQVRRVHEGEGKYAETEEAIRALLQEKGANLTGKSMTAGTSAVPVTEKQSPETYLGSVRASNFENAKGLASAAVQTFEPAATLPKSSWTLGGTWEVQDQKIIARGNSILRYHVAAKEAYIVMGAATPQAVRVLLNGQPLAADVAGGDVTNGAVQVGEYKLYRLLKYPAFRSDGTLELQVPDGVELNVFTFGS
jgi:cytochrome c biogenesis protein CcdA/thiol-disulfide isomerase/thioredoxin